jgi:hypothetical protein
LRISTTIQKTCLQILFIDLTSLLIEIATNRKKLGTKGIIIL